MPSTLQPELPASLTITMLDGDLGAVTDPTRTAVLPRAEEVCWCNCIVCFTGPTEQPSGTDEI